MTSRIRPIQPGDIAVLRFTNAGCTETATALGNLDIQATVARDGLMQTLEGAFLLAATELVLDPRATLPALTLLNLTNEHPIESLVDQRIRTGRLPDHPLLTALRNLAPLN